MLGMNVHIDASFNYSDQRGVPMFCIEGSVEEQAKSVKDPEVGARCQDTGADQVRNCYSVPRHSQSVRADLCM